MNLKQSEYNFIYDDLGKDQVVFYNSRTGALAIVKEEQYKQFTDFLDTGKEIEDEDFLNKLLKCGYLLPSGIDERFLIKTNMMKGRYNKEYLSMTIAPTMACNFRCTYCFEQGYYGNKQMSEATQEDVVQFIRNNLAGVKSVHVAWFGGEPLLGMQVIETLSQKIMALCEEKEIQYSAGIITNGYLLTKDIAEKLKKYHVEYAQITVDGPENVHDRRRPLVNGQGTYQVIMRNLQEIKGILPVYLRINVDYENVTDADKVVNNLKKAGLFDKVHPYLGLVESYNNTYQKDKCLTDELYSRYSLDFLVNNDISLRTTYPKPRRNHCVADHYNGWVVDDEGNLYKCWNDIGNPAKSVGHVSLKENYLQKTELLAEYSSFDPMKCDECGECKMLPVCMGGCPHNRLEGRRVCGQRRFYLQDYMLRYVESLLAAKTQLKEDKE